MNNKFQRNGQPRFATAAYLAGFALDGSRVSARLLANSWILRIISRMTRRSEVGKPDGVTFTRNSLTTVVSGIPGHRDVLSPSPASLAAPFLPVGKSGREL